MKKTPYYINVNILNTQSIQITGSLITEKKNYEDKQRGNNPKIYFLV